MKSTRLDFKTANKFLERNNNWQWRFPNLLQFF